MADRPDSPDPLRSGTQERPGAIPAPHTAPEFANAVPGRLRVAAIAAALAAVTAVLGGYLASLAIGFGWVIEQALRAGYLG